MERVQDTEIAARLARCTKSMTQDRNEIEKSRMEVMCGARAKPWVGVGFVSYLHFSNVTTSKHTLPITRSISQNDNPASWDINRNDSIQEHQITTVKIKSTIDSQT